MGLFDTEQNESKDEVVIRASEDENSGKETRLGKQVETSLVGDNPDEAEKTSSDVTREDLYEQNQRIIELLEKLVDKEDESVNSSSGNRVTDRRNSGKTGDDDTNIGDGMNELL